MCVVGYINNAIWRYNAPEKERYGLERLDLTNPKNRHIQASLVSYADSLTNVDKDLCVYFEAVGSSISGSRPRYRHLPGFSDLRVFDIARNGEYVFTLAHLTTISMVLLWLFVIYHILTQIINLHATTSMEVVLVK